jgi:hypothetical protein
MLANESSGVHGREEERSEESKQSGGGGVSAAYV